MKQYYTACVIYWTPSKQEGYKVQTMPYHVSEGAVGSFNIYLEQSNIPIPEMTSPIPVTATLITITFVLARRRRRNTSSL